MCLDWDINSGLKESLESRQTLVMDWKWIQSSRWMCFRALVKQAVGKINSFFLIHCSTWAQKGSSLSKTDQSLCLLKGNQQFVPGRFVFSFIVVAELSASKDLHAEWIPHDLICDLKRCLQIDCFSLICLSPSCLFLFSLSSWSALLLSDSPPSCTYPGIQPTSWHLPALISRCL